MLNLYDAMVQQGILKANQNQEEQINITLLAWTRIQNASKD